MIKSKSNRSNCVIVSSFDLLQKFESILSIIEASTSISSIGGQVRIRIKNWGPRYSHQFFELHNFVAEISMNFVLLDGHFKGQYLRFGPKWVINITKLGMQICSFWQNSRPLRPKMALIRGIIEIERAVFVLLALFWHMKRRCLGKAESEGTFLHTLLYSNTRKEDFWSRETFKSTSNEYLCFCVTSQQSETFMLTAVFQLFKGRLL